MEEYIMMGFFRITGEFEKPIDEDPMSNCCTAPFTYPGWPDSDMCSKCYEHADISEEE
tara:strand:+ start:196 stop:369 length:174 start_codon:yes stop_codon:yes gene_type:complete